jgi:hypothetical protein
MRAAKSVSIFDTVEGDAVRIWCGGIDESLKLSVVAIVEGIQCSPDDHFEAFFVMLYVIEVTI